jgi:hypothetical protein
LVPHRAGAPKDEVDRFKQARESLKEDLVLSSEMTLLRWYAELWRHLRSCLLRSWVHQPPE